MCTHFCPKDFILGFPFAWKGCPSYIYMMDYSLTWMFWCVCSHISHSKGSLLTAQIYHSLSPYHVFSFFIKLNMTWNYIISCWPPSDRTHLFWVRSSSMLSTSASPVPTIVSESLNIFKWFSECIKLSLLLILPQYFPKLLYRRKYSWGLSSHNSEIFHVHDFYFYITKIIIKNW